MIRMIVCSFYNTLIDKEDAIPVSTMLEIERIRNKGIIFSVCTNHTYQEVLSYNKDFPFLDYIVSLNGSYIYDVKKERCLSKNKISIANVKKLLKLFAPYKTYYYTQDNIYENPEEIDTEVYKVEVELEQENIPNLVKKMNLNTSIITLNNKKYLEITSNKSTMFEGVDQISLKNNINLSEILVLCSNESDISLLSNIPHSYITENSIINLNSDKKFKKVKSLESVLKRIK